MAKKKAVQRPKKQTPKPKPAPAPEPPAQPAMPKFKWLDMMPVIIAGLGTDDSPYYVRILMDLARWVDWHEEMAEHKRAMARRRSRKRREEE